MSETVVVNTPLKSKINALQVLAAVGTLATALGLPISEDQKLAVLTVSGVAVPILTGIFRTFFTKKHKA